MSLEATLLVLTWIAILMLALGLSGLLRQVRILSIEAATLQPLSRPNNQVATLKQITTTNRLDSPSLILFVDPGCSVCSERLDELLEVTQQERPLHVVVVAKGELDWRSANAYVIDGETGIEVAYDLGIWLAPSALWVEKDRVVSSASVGSKGELGRFVENMRGARVNG